MGDHFKAIFMGVLTAASNLGCIFFCILTSGLEQCDAVFLNESTARPHPTSGPMRIPIPTARATAKATATETPLNLPTT